MVSEKAWTSATVVVLWRGRRICHNVNAQMAKKRTPGQLLVAYRDAHPRADGSPMLQADLAIALGISVSYLSELENGRGVRRLSLMGRIQEVVGIPLTSWLGIPRSARSERPVKRKR